MEFRRITSLPPYVFTIIDSLKIEQRRAGKDIIDLGFGNPDLASPDVAVDKLIEAAQNSRNHRYSSSRGIPKLREAIAGYYQRRFGVTLDPETEVINTIGAKEGFSHLMWTLLQPGDAAQHGGLAAARGADEDDELAVADLEVDAGNDHRIAESLLQRLEEQVGHGVRAGGVCGRHTEGTAPRRRSPWEPCEAARAGAARGRPRAAPGSDHHQASTCTP